MSIELLKQETETNEKVTDIKRSEAKVKEDIIFNIKELLKQDTETVTIETDIKKYETKVKEDITYNINVIVNSNGPPLGDWQNVYNDQTLFPSGLKSLYNIDQLLVHQKVDFLEVIVGFETNNKFIISDRCGQKVYYAVENKDCCTRFCFSALSPLGFRIMDNFQNEVIHLERPLASLFCMSLPCPYWLQSLEVSAPPGTVVGSIKQEWSLYRPSFLIKDASGEVVLRIKGPVCTVSVFGGDVNFYVYSKDGETKVGKITKQWSGRVRPSHTDPDCFGVSFPMDLDVRIKAVLLGACFLIDNMYFEKRTKNMAFY